MSPSEIISLTIAAASLMMVLIFNLIHETKAGKNDAKTSTEDLTDMKVNIRYMRGGIDDIKLDLKDIKKEQTSQNDRLTKVEMRVDGFDDRLTAVEKWMDAHK